MEKNISKLTDDLKYNKDLLNQKMKEINDLKIQLQNKEKTIELLNNQISNKITELNNLISNKIIELNNMKNKISNNNNDDLINVINPGEKIIAAQFISTDQKITYAIPCKNTTPFVRVEEKLYEEYPEYKETENHFIHNGTVIKRFKTIGENNIKSGKPIILNTGN